MRKWLTAFLAFVGVASGAPASDVVMVDPKDLLMSIPTISDDLAEVEKPGTVSSDDLVFHEDDWMQIEFFDAGRLSEMQAKLTEFKAFEAANRHSDGAWKKLYLRVIPRRPVVGGTNAAAKLAKTLGTKVSPAPVLTTSGVITGRVKSGFTLRLDGGVALYGYTQDGEIRALGAHLGKDADHLALTNAFVKLNAERHLILVDWIGQVILTGTTNGEVEAWRP